MLQEDSVVRNSLTHVPRILSLDLKGICILLNLHLSVIIPGFPCHLDITLNPIQLWLRISLISDELNYSYFHIHIHT